MGFQREPTSVHGRHLLLALLAFRLVFCPAAAAQSSGSETDSTGTTTAQIIVHVREVSGEPLSVPALVRLFRSDGMPLGQASTSSGGQVVFRKLPLGDYTVVAQAPGYKTGNAEAGLPIPVPVEIDVYLKPESSALGTAEAPALPVLAPKAQKELQAGLDALRGEKLDVAEKHLDAAARLAPAHPDVLYLLGMLYLRKKDIPRAQGVLEKAAQIDPHHARALAALGTLYANQEKFEQAIPVLKKALQTNGKVWEARWTLEKAYYYHRQYDLALKESQSALAASDGRAPGIELLVAQALTAVGRYEDSAQVLRGFLKNHPEHSQAPLARSWLDRLKQAGKIQDK